MDEHPRTQRDLSRIWETPPTPGGSYRAPVPPETSPVPPASPLFESEPTPAAPAPEAPAPEAPAEPDAWPVAEASLDPDRQSPPDIPPAFASSRSSLPPSFVLRSASRPPSRFRPTKVVSLVVVVAVLAGAAFAGTKLFSLRGSSDVLENMVPSDATGYVTTYLDPALGQKLALRDLVGKFPALRTDRDL